MIKISIPHWTIEDGKHGMLFFAQTLEELIAPHSHDSYKVSALNFHYICYETLKVIELIEEDVLDKGNLVPLWAELKMLFQRDVVAQSLLGSDFESIFYKKNNKGEFDKQPIKIEAGKDVDSNLQRIKKGIAYIADELDRNNQYYIKLTQEIKASIKNGTLDPLKFEPIFDLTRIFASELINQGFSQSYIYDCVKQTFFDPAHDVSTVDVIDNFFACFSVSEHKYSVYLPLSSFKQKKALEDYGPFKIVENVYELFDPAIVYVLKYTCVACDPYAAREDAITLANFCLSINQFLRHNKYDYNPKYAEVFDQESKVVTFIKKPEPPIVRGYTNCGQLQINDLLRTCINLSERIIQVLQLHSMALISSDSRNQLINLWTAVEVAVPVIRKDGLSRINQISNVLTASLGWNYFSSLTEQLLLDINIANEGISERIQQIEYNGTPEEKLLAILFLPQFSTLYEEIFEVIMQESPLLGYRIYRYKSKWSCAQDIKNFYLAHSERLSQQIMRIYRTRNMFIHDGSEMRYTDYVLQNLHYYVDTFIRFLCTHYKLGYRSVQSIVDAVQFQEYQYLQSLSGNSPINANGIKTYILRQTNE